MKSRNLTVSTRSHTLRLQASLCWKALAGKLDRLWQSFTYFAEVKELRITQKRDRQGELYFEIYDFSSGKYHRFDSEQDVRIWIDRTRY